MDTSEIQARKLKLRDELFQSIQKFIDETGCWPDITIDKMEVEQIGFKPSRFPNISITVHL